MNPKQKQMYEVLCEHYGTEVIDLMTNVQPVDHILNEDMWDELGLMGLVSDSEYGNGYYEDNKEDDKNA